MLKDLFEDAKNLKKKKIEENKNKKDKEMKDWMSFISKVIYLINHQMGQPFFIIFKTETFY